MITNKNSEFKILVVDDYPDMLRITERLLKEQNYIVSTTVSGQECLQAIRLDKPDLLLLYVMLPDISGIDICKTIKKDPQLSTIFVFLLSGMKTQSENISEGLETGADGSPMPPSEYASVRALSEGVQIENVEMGIRKGDGQVTWINVSATPIPLEGYGVAIVYTDLTARKQIEDELRKNKEGNEKRQ